MKYTIHIGDKPIILEHDNFDQSINVDDLTTINASNVYGEAVTIAAATNRIGLMKAEIEAKLDLINLDIKLFEADFKAELRKQASNNSGKYKVRVGEQDVEVKLTETGLKDCFENDPNWIKLKKDYITAKKQFNQLDALYWSTQSKDKKLNNLINGVTPEEFVDELIEGKINGILIKK